MNILILKQILALLVKWKRTGNKKYIDDAIEIVEAQILTY